MDPADFTQEDRWHCCARWDARRSRRNLFQLTFTSVHDVHAQFMPAPTLPVAPVRSDDPKKPKKDEKDDGKVNGTPASASKVNEEKEGEGEELVCVVFISSVLK